MNKLLKVPEIGVPSPDGDRRQIRRGEITVNVITSPRSARAFMARQALRRDPARPFSLDFETTGLSADTGQVRLTCIGIHKNIAYVLDHAYCGSFASLAGDLVPLGPFYVFNNCFEGAWFDDALSTVTDVSLLLDVGHMRRAVLGGGPLDLKTMIKRDLGIVVDKELQQSNWAGILTEDQYFYGGLDAVYTRRLGVQWKAEMSPEQYNGFRVINDAWRAVNECSETGMLLDAPYHRKLVAMWNRRIAASERSLRKFVSETEIKNLRSKKQWSDALKRWLDDDAISAWPKTAKTKQLQTDRAILRSMSYISPYPFSRVLAALMVFNRAEKYAGTYGETLITKQLLSADGRIHGRLNMAQAVTGRFSSSGPNLQNIPRSPVVRRSFIAGPTRKKVLADYSGIEIRTLAEMSGDQILLNDTIYDDVHSRSAIAIYQHDATKFLDAIKAKNPRAKEQRSKAKGFTFQLLYGAAAAALSIVLRCSLEEAEEAIKKWAERYSKGYNFRHYMNEKMTHTGFLPCASGRTIFVHKQDRSLPVAANYPIQGSAGDVMYRAMYHVQKLLDESSIGALMMTSVHDELLLLSDESCAEDAKEILETGMIRGWLDIFPGTNTDNLVDATIGDTWADKQ